MHTISRVISLLLFLLLSGSASELAAQSRGSGSGAEPLTARVIADVFRERFGSDSSVYLIVLWRGQEFWNRRGSSGGASSGSSSGFPGTTVSYSSTEGGVWRTIYFDGRAQRVVINSRDTVRTSADSTLIVMVDRVDSVGGPPVVTNVKIAKLPSATIYSPPPAVIPTREEYARLIQEFMATGRVDNNFSRFLATVPVVREFIR